MAWGALAEAMAQGLRGKRIGEERQYTREQDLLDRVQAGDQRAEERERYKAQQERLTRGDALAAELTRAQLEQRGPFAPKALPPAGPPPTRQTNRGIEEWDAGGREWVPTGLTPWRAPTSSGGGGGDPRAVAAEDTRRRALIQRGDANLRNLPKDVIGEYVQPEMAQRIGEISDSIAGEMGAPPPATRTNPWAGLQGPAAPGGTLAAQPIYARPPQAQTPPPAPSLSSDEVTAARQMIGRRSPDEAQRLLAGAGYSAAEVQQILGGGGRE